MSDDRDSFFAELQPQQATQAPPSAASAIDLEGDDGWFERAASDELGAHDRGPHPATAIGAAALTADRELAPRAARRRRHRPRLEQTGTPQRARRTRPLAAFAAIGVLLALGLAVLVNPPHPSSQDAANNRDTGSTRAVPAAQRDRRVDPPRHRRRAAPRPARTSARRHTQKRPVRRITSSTSTSATPAPTSAAPPAVSRRRATPAIAAGRARPSFTPGDLPTPSRHAVDRPALLPTANTHPEVHP